MSKTHLCYKPYARPPNWSCQGGAQVFRTGPGDAWPITAAWHLIRALCVWHTMSNIFEHPNSRENANFFSLKKILRKIVTVTFKDFLKTCRGDTYPDDKKDRMCNYSLLAAVQVSDDGWFHRQNQQLLNSPTDENRILQLLYSETPVCTLTTARPVG